MLNYDTDIYGSFDLLPDKDKETVMEIVANFHIRNGVVNDDGSVGEMQITNRQMNDCLAWVFRHNV